jgi:hypothetical protein
MDAGKQFALETRETLHKIIRRHDNPNETLLATDLTTLPPFPELPLCYGWTLFETRRLPRLAQEFLKLSYAPSQVFAIVYELVEGIEQDIEVGQRHLDFFYATGFAMEAYKRDDWRGGRLVDHGCVRPRISPFWTSSDWRPRDASKWFNDLDWRHTGKSTAAEILKYHKPA